MPSLVVFVEVVLYGSRASGTEDGVLEGTAAMEGKSYAAVLAAASLLSIEVTELLSSRRALILCEELDN